MDLLSKDEPLINLNGYDSTEEGDDLLGEEFQPHHQRRISSSKHASLSNRQHRLPSGSKVYLRELSPVRKEQSMERHNSAIVSAVERTMKNYADGVLRVLEGMSGRLSQLESISQDLEHSVTTLAASVEENHEHTDRNFKILNERIMEVHRSVQILRDKQDIIEAHAQLEKLQTSKALAEKESSPGPAIIDPQETVKVYQQQEHALQVQSQKSLPQPHVSQPLSLALSQPPSLAPQPIVSRPQSLATPQYQAPNLQSQQLVPVQHVPRQEASGQAIQQINKPSEQVQYQSVPQQLQPMLPSLPPPILQTQQPLEQGRYQSMPSQMQMQQPPLQQGSSQLPLQGTTPQQTEQAHYQSAPQQRQIQVPQSQASVQQPFQPQQGMATQQPMQGQQGIVTQQPIQAHQGVVPQQPLHLQQQSSSRVQGSFQYYGQPNESYAALAPGTPNYAQGAYIPEPVRDSANFTPHQRPLPHNPTQLSSQLPPVQSFHHMSLTPPQVPQSSHESGSLGNVSGPMTWNRQANLGIPNAAPHLHTVRADYPPPEGSGIVEKVVAMGFSRDQVQSVIRRLAERNQSVDMNVVIDILMNGGRGIQGGFGR